MKFRSSQNPTSTGVRAFSLIELLTVVALISVLTMAAVPIMGNLSSGGQEIKNLITLSGTLEKAREYAVSRNTYTWVTLEKLKSEPEKPVLVMTFASADGSKAGVTPGSSFEVPGTSRDVIPIDQPQKLHALELEEEVPSGNALRDRLSGSASFLAKPNAGPTFKYRLPGNQTKDFSYSVMFTPSGEARISAALPENIQVVLTPLKGEVVPNPAAASVIRISGLTGRVKVFRP